MGARTFTDWHRGCNAYVLASGRRRILYGGDTAYGPHFRSMGGVDLAVLGIAGYDPYLAAHATPEQALAMANDAGAEHILPMHHRTFRLSHEPMHEPFERLMTALGADVRCVVVGDIGGKWRSGIDADKHIPHS